MSTTWRLSKHRQSLEVDVTKVPQGIDELTFFSPSIPEEVKLCISVLHESTQADFRIALKSVFEYLVYDKLEDSNSNAFLTEDVADNSIIEAGLYKILHLIIRKKIKMTKLSEDLQKMNMPTYAIDDIVRLLTVHRANIENTIKMKSIGFPRLLSLQWRINVVISSGTLSSVMKPTVLFKMILSDGSSKSFSVSVEQFHQLRYGVAKVLSNMQKLERHPILRIINDFERKDLHERTNLV